MNRVFPSLHGASLEISPTVPLTSDSVQGNPQKRTKVNKSYFEGGCT